MPDAEHLAANPLKLPGDYYFNRAEVPLALKKVHGHARSHVHDYTDKPHWHDFSELVMITGGRGVQNINGVSYRVLAGDVFVIMGRTMHYFEEYGELEIINIMFDRRVLEEQQEYLNRIPGYHVIFHLEPGLRTSRKFHNMLHLDSAALNHAVTLSTGMEMELGSRSPGFEAAALAGFFQLTVFLSRSLDGVSGNQGSVARLAGLFSALEKTLAQPWDLRRMAKYCSMSPNTLLRTFQVMVGQTPGQYLSALRLNAASGMLADGSRSIAEIAFACGYRDSNYFSKCFRRRFGQSPGQFRRLAARGVRLKRS